MPPLTPTQISRLAQKIYESNHLGFEGLPNNRTAPCWEATSDSMKDWCRRQARAAEAYFVDLQRYSI
jgi:hypothetical protein